MNDEYTNSRMLDRFSRMGDAIPDNYERELAQWAAARIRELERQLEYYEVHTHELQQEMECLHEEIGELRNE